jgi:hypothetical protein
MAEIEVTHAEAWLPKSKSETDRAKEARQMPMDVEAVVEDGETTGEYEVTEQETGDTFTVDPMAFSCECRDHRFDNAYCPHQRRVDLCREHTDLAGPGVSVE